MKKALAALCILAVLALAPRPAPAQYLSTRDLATLCLGDRKEQMAACINYVAGVIDYHLVMQSFGTAPTISFCIPEDISKEEAAVLVMVYLRGAPENDPFTAAATIPLALSKAFPCRKSTGIKKKR